MVIYYTNDFQMVVAREVLNKTMCSIGNIENSLEIVKDAPFESKEIANFIGNNWQLGPQAVAIIYG